MRVLHSKHQKLILQCYPPGKSADKKPNPLELSYLLYYASTRRVKLEKVIDFLDRKTRSDAHGNKSGNLQVTLSIISALIEKCSDNLNVFAFQVCSILTSVLNTGELPLGKSVVATYGVLCSKLDGGLFSGDKVFVNSFTELTDNLIKSGVEKLKTPGPNQNDWAMIALMTSRFVFHCLNFNTVVSHRFIGTCVPLLSQTVKDTTSYDTLLTRLNSYLNVEKDDRKISRAISAAPTPYIKEHLEEDSLTQTDLNEEALHGLRTLFNTSLSNQITEATVAVVEFNFRNTQEDEQLWAITFLEMCASWIPVQLRFVALLTLLSRITSISDHLTSKENNYPQLVHYGKSILGLVSSDFNMIGLSITDIIQLLLGLQTNLYLVQADSLTADQVEHLSGIFSQCICSLSSHIYYFDQVLDSIVAILFQIDSALITSTALKVGRVHALVLTFLDTISTILNLLARKMSTITRNHATLENWESSFLLLSFSKSYKEFLADATPDQVASIQSKYLAVFNEFLSTELIKGDEKSEENITEPATGENHGKFLTPNYNGYIENAENPLAHLLIHCDEFFADSSVNLYVNRLLVDTLQTLLGITGLNFVHNFIPFFQHWQLAESTKSLPLCSRDTSAYILLKALLRVIGEKYQENSHIDIDKLDLSRYIDEDVEDRRKHAVWVDELDGTKIQGALSSGEPLANHTNKKTMHEFFSQTNLQKWAATSKSNHLNGSPSNGHLAELLGGPGSHSSDEQFEDSRSTQHPVPTGGFGLGSANDISSIHSGLVNGTKLNGYSSPDATHITSDTLPSIGSNFVIETNNYKHSLMPRVSDLKQSVSGAQVQDDLFSFTNDRANGTPRSVLQRQIHTTDVSSILNGLTSEDDAEIVV